MQGRTAKKVKLTVATEKKNDGIQASLAKALTTYKLLFIFYIPMGAQREDPQQRSTIFLFLFTFVVPRCQNIL